MTGAFASGPDRVTGGRRTVARPTSVQAHRGSPDPETGILENTRAAFARARALGADGVELDVRRTADGALAVHHDPVVPGAGPVHELAAADLPPHVPLLADAFAELVGLTVNIEVKNLPTEAAFDPEEQVAVDVARLVVGTGRTDAVVSSFWPGTLAAAAAAGPDLRTGLLVLPGIGAEAAVDSARRLGCAAVHLPLALVDPSAVGRAHAAGLAVAAWTVSDAAGLAAALAAGVDTVITDDVAAARATLGPPG